MTDKRAIYSLLSVFMLCALFLIRIHGPRIFFIAAGDDETYFAYSRALSVDRDFSFQDVPLDTFRNSQNSGKILAARCSAGPGILWSPFLALGHIFTTVLSFEGRTEASPGTSITHWIFVSAGSILYGLGGFIFLYCFLRRYFNTGAAFWSTFLVGFSSPLLYYLFRRPLMSHSTEFFCLTASLYFISGLKPSTNWFIILFSALVTGFIFLCRYSDLPYLLSFLTWGTIRLGSARKKQIVFFCASIFTASAQLFLWRFLTGSFCPGPRIFSEALAKINVLTGFYPWTLKHLSDLFIGVDWGIFLLSPITLITVFFSLPFLFKKNYLAPRMVILIPVFFNIWGAANWPSHGGEFGNRYIIPLWVLFTFLFAEILSRFDKFARGKILMRLIIICAVLLFFYSSTALSLFKTNAASLTLHVGQTKYGLQSDWVNYSFAQNAFSEIIKSPLKALTTLGPSLAGYIIYGFLKGAKITPCDYILRMDAYFIKHGFPSNYHITLLLLLLILGEILIGSVLLKYHKIKYEV